MIMKSWTFVMLAVVCISCYETDLDATAISSDSDERYFFATNLGDLELDPFQIIGITPDRLGWDVIVEYSGGCEEHQFFASWSGEFLEGSPLQTVVGLGHVGNSDPCEAILRDTVRLEFNELFYGAYPSEGLDITLVDPLSGRSITVQNSLAQLVQGNFCNLNASLESAICGEGIWQDKWFKVQDPIGDFESIWFQPVTNNAAVSLEIPEDGNYDIGVTLLFGYQFQSEDIMCQALPEGAIIPVSINCMEKD